MAPTLDDLGHHGSVQHKKESLGTYLSHGFPKKKTTTLLDYEAALRVRVQIGIVCALAFSHLNSMFLCPGWPSKIIVYHYFARA